MRHLLLLIVTLSFLNACMPIQQVVIHKNISTKVITAVGHSALSNYKNYPLPQQNLLAIRGAKLDAYRNLAEEVHGVRIKSNTTVKDLIVENDSYRAYVDAVLRGAHLISVTPKENGIYEAEVTLTITPEISACLYQHSFACDSDTSFNSDSMNSLLLVENTTTDDFFSSPNNYAPPFTGLSYDCEQNCSSTDNSTYYFAY